MKKCIDFEVENVPRGRTKKTRREVIEKNVRPDKYARKMLWTTRNGKS